MEFRKYQHIERFGTSEVEGIEIGTVHVFPKIDGTNASAWLADNGLPSGGSRRRCLSIDDDNAGFFAWLILQDNILRFLNKYPHLRLYGEWLVPHSLKTYKDSAWRNFYVFDVVNEQSDGEQIYLPYETYKPLLDEFGIEYIPPIAVIRNSNYEQLVAQLEKNDYLIKDGEGHGEGIVIKNYQWKNRYGRQTWAKIVSSEFKEKHKKAMGVSPIDGKKMVEQEIADEYVTKALCEKVYAKIDSDGGFTSRNIPQLLNTVYYDVIREDIWDMLKKHKFPTINFKTLQHIVYAKVKENLPKLF